MLYYVRYSGNIFFGKSLQYKMAGSFSFYDKMMFMKNTIKIYTYSIISIVCVFLYFTPWLFEINDRRSPWFFMSIASVLWFFVAWIVLIIKVISAMQNIEKHDSVHNRHEVISSLIIVACYIILIGIVFSNYYFLVV